MIQSLHSAPSILHQVHFAYIYLSVCFVSLLHFFVTLNDADAFDQFFTPPGQTQKCQFLVKACQNVFRNLRGVESLRIYFDNNEVHGQEETENDNNEIVFEVKCSHRTFV